MRKPILLLFAPLLLFSCAEDNSTEVDKLHRQVDSLLLALEQENRFSDSLETKIKSTDSIKAAYPIFFGNKYQGIENPEEFIKSQLRNQPDKIPISPVLGGEMKFRKIDILSEKWLLAIYDDGHVQGKAIMEYELLPNGSVEYTIVATQE